MTSGEAALADRAAATWPWPYSNLRLPNAVRIVLEVDGKQHYADGETASPQLYSQMAAEDRRLRLRGYEVYRFGGFELSRPEATATLRAFFDDLLKKHAAT